LSFDVSEGMWDRVTEPARIEKAISFAASAAAQAIGRGIETGLYCNGRIVDGEKNAPFVYIEPKAGEGQLRLILEHLAMLVMVRSYSFGSLTGRFVERRDTDVSLLIVAPFADERMKRQTGMYRAHGGYASIVEI
jgi:uncharacterized protein (DUF58 family)